MRRCGHVNARLDDRFTGGELINWSRRPERRWSSLAPGPGEGEAQTKDSDESRREFLKVAAAVSAVLALGGIASVMKAVVIPAVPGSTESSFPRVKISTLSELATGSVVTFNYPLDNEPNILVKLGQKASGGVGPDGDIVAFSQVCQHLGCIWGYVPQGKSPSVNPSYIAKGPSGYCPCHGSIFDLTLGAKVIGGPAPRPEPQVKLEVDGSGNILAVGMSPPAIFGHNTGSSNVNDDLQGGNLVSGS